MKYQMVVVYNNVEYVSKIREVTGAEYEAVHKFCEQLRNANYLKIETTNGEVYFPAEVIQKSIVKLITIED